MEQERLAALVAQEVARDVMTSVLASDEGELHTHRDAGRLEEFLEDGISAAMDRHAKMSPGVRRTAKELLAIAEGAATDSLGEWTVRREVLLRDFVDPGITEALAAAHLPGEAPPSPPPCCLIAEVRREILEALDRPPVQSDTALNTAAAAMAWLALRDWIRHLNQPPSPPSPASRRASRLPRRS